MTRVPSRRGAGSWKLTLVPQPTPEQPAFPTVRTVSPKHPCSDDTHIVHWPYLGCGCPSTHAEFRDGTRFSLLREFSNPNLLWPPTPRSGGNDSATSGYPESRNVATCFLEADCLAPQRLPPSGKFCQLKRRRHRCLRCRGDDKITVRHLEGG